MQQLGYGVIGLGTVAARHLECAEALPGAQLVAVADQNLSRAQEVSEQFASHPRPYQDYRELLADPAVEVVVICLPTQLHPEATVAAAAAGKHIYCEKAMAATLRGCREMIEATAAAGVKLNIGQSTRFQPIQQQLRRLIESDEVGEVVAGEFRTTSTTRTLDTVPVNYRWRYEQGARGHGAVVNQACHYIDTLRFLSAQDPVRVSATIGDRYAGHVDPEDQYVISAVCDGQALLTISEYGSPFNTPTLNNGYFIFGSKGVLSYRYSRGAIITLELPGEEPRDLTVAEDLQTEDAFLRLHRLFYESLVNDTPVPVSGEVAMRNIHCSMGAYVANDQHKWMDLPLGEEWYDYYGPEREETIPGKVPSA